MVTPPHLLNLLIVEDNEADATLVIRELRRTGLKPEWQRVDNEGDYLTLLHEDLDLVISDFDLPQFNGMRALELLKQRHVEIPFILVSGTIGEDVAVEAMRRGATDYLLKDRLARLGPAAQQAVTDGRLRRERRLAEAALRASEERFRELAENINEVFWITDPAKERMLYISPAYERIWGRTCASLYERPQAWLEAIHPDDRVRVRAAMVTKQVEGRYDEEYRIIRKDGTERRIRDRAFAVRDATGAVLRVVGVAEDVTESRKLQEQFLRSQRLEAIGSLAGGIAHDLNNILTPIVTATDLLTQRLTEARDKQLLNLIRNAADRGSRVVRQMMAYSRGIAGERAAVQCRDLVREMITIMRETFPRDIRIETELAPDLRSVTGDATQILQVLMNLCMNARDAMPRGGRLTLTAVNANLDEDAVADQPGAQPGPYIRLAVADTGHGIPADHLERIFEPFYSTKPLAKGTGLGLSTALGIIRSHRGFITVVSQPDGGTTFSVLLPAVTGGPAVARVTSGTELPPGGRAEAILFVDDEESIRFAIEVLLRQHGYEVEVAADGREALAAYERLGAKIRLVLTDVMMPVMGGIDLIKCLRERNQHIPIIATSGMADNAAQTQLLAVGANEILPKPYSMEILLKTIHRLLNAPGVSATNL